MRIGPEWLALRCVQIQRCFANSQFANLAYLELPHVMRIGEIARIADILHMRGDTAYRFLVAMGSILGLQPSTIDADVRIMEELGWVRISKRSEGDSAMIEPQVPRMAEVLEKAGELCSEPTKEIPLGPLNEIEKATIFALHTCAGRPCTFEAIKSELNIDPEESFDRLRFLGNAGGYLLHTEVEERRDAFWSPIFYYNGADKIMKFLQRQTSARAIEIREVLEICSKSAGIPLNRLNKRQRLAAAAAIRWGLILPVNMWTTEAGEPTFHTFLFAPTSTFDDSSPSGQVFEKPKVLLALLQMGRHFTRVKIRDPVRVFQSIRTNGGLGISHRDGFLNYRVPTTRGLLMLKGEGVVTFCGAEWTLWMPYFIRSEDNLRALEIAESLIPPSQRKAADRSDIDIKAADLAFKFPTSCLEPLEFRASAFAASLPRDDGLERAAEKLAVTMAGGVYR